MTASKKAPAADGAEAPAFTRGQLLGAKRFGAPRDILEAVLAEDERYTMDQAETLVRAFLERRVK